MDGKKSASAANPGIVRGAGTLPALLIAGAAAVVYAGTFHAPFVFDDLSGIAENASIRRLWPPTWLLQAPADTGPSGRPLLSLSFALNYAAGGTAVVGYHAVNLALLVLAALVLREVVGRILVSPRLGSRYADSAGSLSTAVALLWVVHPILTETVTYVSQRSELLMGLFGLLAVLGLLRAANGGPSELRWICFSVGCTWLGMAAKETMASVPILILAVDATFVSEGWGAALRARRRYYALLAAGWVLLAALMVFLARHSVGFQGGISPWRYALTESLAIRRYLCLAFWPRSLVFDYGAAFAGDLPSALPYVAAILLLVGTGAMALWVAPRAGFPILAFFVLLAPTSSVVPVYLQPTAENRMFLPLAAVAAGFVLAVHRILGWRSYWVFALFAVALAGATADRNRDYRSAVTLWRDTVSKVPDSPRAHFNLGRSLVDEGRSDEAVPELRTAARQAPQLGVTHFALARACFATGHLVESEREYHEAARLSPIYAIDVQSRLDLGMIALRQGRISDARGEFQEALRLDPGNKEARARMGSLSMP
jgi:protein O-mannosyl-transferase